MALIHTQSSLRTALRCSEKWSLEYLCNYRSTEEIPPLAQGDVIHAGINAFWRTQLFLGGHDHSEQCDHSIEPTPCRNCEAIKTAMKKAAEKYEYFSTEEGQLEYMKIEALVLSGYVNHWPRYRRADVVAFDLLQQDGPPEIENMLVPVCVELRFQEEINGIAFAGKFDVVACPLKYWPDITKKLYVIDHKSTSYKEACQPGSNFLMKQDMDIQATIYKEAARKMFKVKDVTFVHDFLVKLPSAMKPLQRVRRKKTETDEQFEIRKQENKESKIDFYERCKGHFHWTPGEHFHRREILTTEETHQYLMKDLCQLSKDLESGVFHVMKNPQMCMFGSRPCPFLGYCLGMESLETGKFKRLKSPHPELENENGREIPDEDDATWKSEAAVAPLWGTWDRKDDIRVSGSKGSVDPNGEGSSRD